METKVADVLQGNKVDAILCVAGGWGGGNAASAGGQQAEHHSSRACLQHSYNGGLSVKLYVCVCVCAYICVKALSTSLVLLFP